MNRYRFILIASNGVETPVDSDGTDVYNAEDNLINSLRSISERFEVTGGALVEEDIRQDEK